MSIHMVEYYPVLEGKEILTQATIQMKLGDTILSEISQSHKKIREIL